MVAVIPSHPTRMFLCRKCNPSRPRHPIPSATSSTHFLTTPTQTLSTPRRRSHSAPAPPSPPIFPFTPFLHYIFSSKFPCLPAMTPLPPQLAASLTARQAFLSALLFNSQESMSRRCPFNLRRRCLAMPRSQTLPPAKFSFAPSREPKRASVLNRPSST